MKRLTQQQSSALYTVSDWKAPFEVANLLYPKGPTMAQRKMVAQVLRELNDDGLVKLNTAQNTYRRTDLGQMALTTGVQ
jgi:hypothetical protein